MNSCDYLKNDNQNVVTEQHYGNCKAMRKNDGKLYPLNDDGTLSLPNEHLSKLKVDVLYHLGMDTESYDLQAIFGDVKFVCMGGTKNRMKEFAEYMSTVLEGKEKKFVNLTKHSHRYAMYKVGPVLSVSHGIGIPSMTILLQEIIKLLYYAKARNPIIFRLGTSGGLNIAPGSLVISTFGLSPILDKTYDLPILGKIHRMPAIFDERLSQELQSLSSSEDEFGTYLGGTFAADDFYRGQGRLDGPFCDHTEEEKLEFLKKLYDLGVRNIEMEATAFAAFTREAGVRSADVCVTLVNRLEGDQVITPKATLLEWQRRPMILIGRYIARLLESNKKK